MRITKLLLYAVMPMMCITVAQAQEKGPKKGDFTVAATVSYNSNVMKNAAAGNLTDYSIAAASTNFSDQKLSVGVEGGWFFSDLWKLNLGGGCSNCLYDGELEYNDRFGTYALRRVRVSSCYFSLFNPALTDISSKVKSGAFCGKILLDMVKYPLDDISRTLTRFKEGGAAETGVTCGHLCRGVK